jgi:hypothetical protein
LLSTEECNNRFTSSFLDFDAKLPPSFADDLRRPVGVVSRSWREEESRPAGDANRLWLDEVLRRPVRVVSRSAWLEEESRSAWLEDDLRRPVGVVSRSWLEEESREWLEDDLRRPVGVVRRSWQEEHIWLMEDRSWLEPADRLFDFGELCLLCELEDLLADLPGEHILSAEWADLLDSLDGRDGPCSSLEGDRSWLEPADRLFDFGELCLLCELEDLLPDLPGELILSAEWADLLDSLDGRDGPCSSLEGDLSFPLSFSFFSEIFSVLIFWSDELLWYFFADGEAFLSARADFPLGFFSCSRCISSCFNSFSPMLSADDREIWSIEDLPSFLLSVLDREGWLLDLWSPVEDDTDITDAESKDASTCFFRCSFSVWSREIWFIEDPRFDLLSFLLPVLDSEGWLLDLWSPVEVNPDIIDADSKDASTCFFRCSFSAECSAALSRKCDETSILSSNQSTWDWSDNLPSYSRIGCCSSLFSLKCPFRPFDFLWLGKAGSPWLDIFISSLDFLFGFPCCFASFSCRSRWMRSWTGVEEIAGFGLELGEMLLRKSSSSCISSSNEDEKAKEEEKSFSMLFAATLSEIPEEACMLKCWGGIEVKDTRLFKRGWSVTFQTFDVFLK